MKIAGFEFPDKCPDNCEFIGDFAANLTCAICIRCPVLCCKKDSEGFCMIEPEDYRKDWAKEWSKFFREGKLPQLPLKMEKEIPDAEKTKV